MRNAQGQQNSGASGHFWFNEESSTLDYLDAENMLHSVDFTAEARAGEGGADADLMPAVREALGDGTLHKAFLFPEVTRAEGAGEGDRVRRFMISDEMPDRGRNIINLDGWVLDAWRANPVVLWAHNSYDLPIAQGRDVEVKRIGRTKKRGLFSSCEFETYDFAQTVMELVDRRTLRGASVGMRPLAMTYNRERAGADFVKSELLEWSIVPIPKNPRSLLVAAQDGVNLEPLKRWALDTLEGIGGEPGKYLPESQLEAAVNFMGWTGDKAFFDLSAGEIEELPPLAAESAPEVEQAGADPSLLVHAVRFGANAPGCLAQADVERLFSARGLEAPWVGNPESWGRFVAGVSSLAARDDKSLVPVLLAAGLGDEAGALQALGAEEPPADAAHSSQTSPPQAPPAPAAAFSSEPVFLVDPGQVSAAIAQSVKALGDAFTAQTGRLILPS